MFKRYDFPNSGDTVTGFAFYAFNFDVVSPGTATYSKQITLNGNGGTTSTFTAKITARGGYDRTNLFFGVYINPISSYVGTREGYELIGFGYNSTDVSSDFTLSNGALLIAPNKIPNDGNFTIYAIWKRLVPLIYMNVNGSWKKAISAYVNVNGTWKKIINIYTNLNGSWKKAR